MIRVLASGNRGKIREFKEAFGKGLKSFDELMEPFEIKESANSFGGNALIKARAIYEKLDNNYIVIADDSGISVPLLGGEPGIYSARYAREGATDKENLEKLINRLKSLGVKKTPAYYTAAIAIISPFGEYLLHSWMYGDIIDTPRGDKGFGYDPIFIPEGFSNTLGELDSSIKAKISHRAKAIELAKPILDMLDRC